MSGKSSVVIYGAIVRTWTQATGLALFALGARTLGVAEFGVFALAAVFINIVQAFLFSGIYEFVMRSRPNDEIDHTSLVLNIGVSCIGAVVSTGMGWAIAQAMHQPEVFHLAAAMAPSSLIAGTQAWHEAQVLRSNNYRIYYANWAVGETVAATCGAFLLLSGAHLYSLVGYRYLQTSLMLGGYILFCPVPYFGKVRLGETRRIMKFAAPIYGSRTLGSLSYYGIDLVVGLVLGPAATGLYRMANRVVASLTEAIFQPLRVLTWIRASRARGSVTRISLGFLPLIQIGTLLLWPASVLLSYLAGDAFRLGLGDKWEPAAPIVATLFLARTVAFTELFLEPLLASTGQGRRLMVMRCLSIAVMIAMIFVLAPLGVSYIGLANLAAALVIAWAVVPPLTRTLGLRRMLRATRDGALVSAAFVALMLLGRVALSLHPMSSLHVHIAVGIVCGLLLLSALAKRKSLILVFRR